MDFLKENILLILLALFAFWMLAWPPLSRRIHGVKEVGAMEATQLINHHDAWVLDVREDSELAAGKVPDARHIPLGQLAGRVADLEAQRSRPVIVVCRSGQRSARACVQLRRQGFPDVYNLAGGMIGWQQASLPVEKKR